jgi:Domain of unknown function (DUF4406)
MKLYLSGPMTGIAQNNLPAFYEAAKAIRAEGWEVISPAELDDEEDRAIALADAPATKTWGDFLARDIKLIADSGIDGIALLPGWENSRGARLEATLGLLCDLTFFEYIPGEMLRSIRRKFINHTIAGTFL